LLGGGEFVSSMIEP